VVGVAPGRVDVALESGRVVNVETAKYPHLEWAWACTTHKSQGQGSELVIASITTDDTGRFHKDNKKVRPSRFRTAS
jgi:ATP-dependent exoDNAse (exonuclease V) alpha subunit